MNNETVSITVNGLMNIYRVGVGEKKVNIIVTFLLSTNIDCKWEFFDSIFASMYSIIYIYYHSATFIYLKKDLVF